jgi:CRISPR-associated endoribonuclease Cas6
MRIKLTFQLTQKPQILPLNYKYPLSSWIYKTLAKADAEFTALLHEHGYRLETGKQFKLFTFSDLQVPKGTWKILGDRMKIWADSVSLIISFMLPEQTQNFVTGLFRNQQITIGDEISQLKMHVQSIEVIKTEIPEQETYTLKCLSPIFLASKTENDEHPQYISPDNDGYKEIFIQNLVDKYKAHCIQINKDTREFDMDSIVFKSLHDKPKSVKQTIKAFKKEQTEIRAFRFNFELSAPRELLEIGLNAGVGAGNSQGFGCCEIMVNNN